MAVMMIRALIATALLFTACRSGLLPDFAPAPASAPAVAEPERPEANQGLRLCAGSLMPDEEIRRSCRPIDGTGACCAVDRHGEECPGQANWTCLGGRCCVVQDSCSPAAVPIVDIVGDECDAVNGCCEYPDPCAPGWACMGGRCCLPSVRWLHDHAPDGGGR